MLEPRINEIKKRRMSKNWSMVRLSEIAGLSTSSILRIENGITKRIHPLRAKEIARALGCRTEDIFYVSEMKKEG